MPKAFLGEMMPVTTQPLWSVQSLTRLTAGPDPVVAVWACERLCDLPPAAGAAALAGLLATGSDAVRLLAAEHLAEYGSPSVLPVLAGAFHRSSGALAGACAAGLGRLGGAARAPELIARWQGGPSAGEQPGLLTGLARTGDPAALALVRTAAAAGAGAQHAWSLLLEYGGAAEVGWAVGWYRRHLRDLGPGVLLDLAGALGLGGALTYYRRSLQAGDWATILREWREELGAYPDAPAVPSLAVSPVRRGEDAERALARLAAAAREIAPAAGPFAPGAARLLAVTGALAAPSGRYGRLKGEALEVAAGEVGLAAAVLEALLYMAVAHRRYPAAATGDLDSLMDLWSVATPVLPDPIPAAVVGHGAAAVPRLAALVTADPDGWATARTVAALAQIATACPEAAAMALPAFLAGQDCGDIEVVERCSRALVHLGAMALPALIGQLDTAAGPRRNEAFRCLSRLPYPETVAAVRQRWERLVEGGPALLAAVCYRLGSQELLTPLREEWRPGEPELTMALDLLCRLHGEEIPGLAANDELNRAVADPTRWVPLACQRCGRTYHYEVGIIYVAGGEEQGLEEIFFQNEVVCKRCGATDAYEVTREAYLAILAELMRQPTPGSPAADNIAIAPPTVLVDGRRMTVRAAIAEYRERIAAEPHNPSLPTGLGNIYRNIGRYPAAAQQYKAALALDPDLPEVHYSLGVVYRELGDEAAARRHYHACRDLIAARPAPDPFLVRVAMAAAEELGLSAPAAAGRNDPCPCGSGRKYKKCCGR